MKMKGKLTILVSNILILLLFGTFIYHKLEGWNWIDSFYFTSVTLTTIGYGDLHPTLPITKLFTVFFAFSGIGLMLYTLGLIATELLTQKPFFEPKSFMKKTVEFVAKEILKDEEERVKYRIKNKFKPKTKQKYKYKPKKRK
ncbi:MAG: two pore domain potassium channel family protein [Candidatus Aenigmarchaeota archaeon]|nr:two pore domain potassium channel family protein [Candidatus Aenigmarchaeota archaeon]